MGILSFLADLRAIRLVDDLTQQLARQAYGLLREGCELRVPRMSHAEARGYLWAKARPIVVAEVARLAPTHSDLSPAVLALLTDRTRQRVVRSVLSDLTRDRVNHVNRRRAA